MMIKYVENFNDYELLDCGNGEKIERFGDYILRRPDPQAIWEAYSFKKYQVNAIYHRSKSGGGAWEFIDLPKKWTINYDVAMGKKISFNLKPFTFKHTGIFPEQAVNWQYIYNYCETKLKTKKDINILNLFAYTGAASIAAAVSGAKVTHVDSSKGILTWAKENATISKVPEDRIRWILDDCKKFVMREIRRGNSYDGIIMDPPSYGRGPSNEIWKFETSIYEFVDLCYKILKKQKSFLMLNSYTTGLGIGAVNYILKDLASRNGIKGETVGYELGLLCKSTGLLLPEGTTVVFEADN